MLSLFAFHSCDDSSTETLVGEGEHTGATSTVDETEFFSTVAPYYYTPVDSANFQELRQQSWDQFMTQAREIASLLSLQFYEDSIHTNIGGYTFTEGDNAQQQVRELSYTFEFAGTDMETVMMFSALMGDLAYEQQEAVIAAQYCEAADANGTEVVYYLDNTDGVPDLLENLGFTDYTLDLTNKAVRLYLFEAADSTFYYQNSGRLSDALYQRLDTTRQDGWTEWNPVESNYLDRSARLTLYLQWFATHTDGYDEQLGQRIAEALATVKTTSRVEVGP